MHKLEYNAILLLLKMDIQALDGVKIKCRCWSTDRKHTHTIRKRTVEIQYSEICVKGIYLTCLVGNSVRGYRRFKKIVYKRNFIEMV